ncbi:MAG: pyridoxal phosphate-dependent aminotransferase [Gammaproteobacteria bacterium]|nr:pyridoxal phosphate-dependent aminotransferase [Gammaproteobacteria bacterium]
MPTYANRMSEIKPSPTIALAQKAKELKANGKHIISLAVGEPDAATPEYIKLAAIKAIENNLTKYTPVNGVIELREAITRRYYNQKRLEYSTEQVTVGCGGKQVIFNALFASLNPGDEVLIPTPYWVSYPDMVKLAGGTPRFITCEDNGDGLKPNYQQLEEMINHKTKWLILNYPNNPTGTILSKQDLRKIADILLKHEHVQILSDDIYEHITFDNQITTNILEVEPRLYPRTFIANGVSKAYAMTGWRLGYGLGNKDLIKKINTLQSQTTYHTSSISQYAAIAALTGTDEFIKQHTALLQKKRDLIVNALHNNTKLCCTPPNGSFYAFFCCEKYLGKIKNDVDFATLLLEREGVAVVPGSAFGMPLYFRLSFALNEDTLKDACERIQRFCKNLIGH